MNSTWPVFRAHRPRPFTKAFEDDHIGDGSFIDDIQGDEPGTADLLFQFRAERMQQGDGRAYTATDGSGNEATDSATVEVPANQGQ